MTGYRIALAIAVGLLFPATSATAWWQWYSQSIPYSPVPEMWFYHNVPMSGLFVEQSQSPAGYSVRIRTGQTGLQDIEVGLEGRILVIKQREASRTAAGVPMWMQKSGWTTRWVSLPEDANVGALRMLRNGDLIEIFVPRVRW